MSQNKFYHYSFLSFLALMSLNAHAISPENVLLKDVPFAIQTPTLISTPSPNGKPTGTKIGIVDTGFALNLDELSNNVLATYNYNSPNMDDIQVAHGTYVAQVIANKNLGLYKNAQLLLGKAADQNGVIYPIATSTTAIWAMDQGARVVSFSLGELFRIQRDAYLDMYTYSVKKDVALTLAAGNNYSNVQQNGNISARYNNNRNLTWIFDPQYKDILNNTVIVGALDKDNNLMSYSYFPGENVGIQNRFLTANVPVIVNGVQSTPANQMLMYFEGTSAATPQAASVLGKLIEKWPHLTAAQSTSIILESADKSFSNQYQLNNCGPNQNINCGSYFFGQGRLDEKRAFQPIGALGFPQTINNQVVMSRLNESNIELPINLVKSVVDANITFSAFDNYLRDYQINFKDMYATTAQKQAKLINQWNDGKNTTQVQTSNFNMKLGFDQTKQLPNTSLKFSNNNMNFSFAQNTNNSLNEFTNLFNFTGNKNNFSLFENQSNAKFGYQINKDVEISYGLTKSTQTSTDTTKKSLLGNALSVQYQVNPEIKLTTGLTNYKENNSLFGVNGRGTFAFSDSMHNAINFGTQAKVNNIDLFFNSQLMYGNAKSTSNTVAVKNLFANEFTLGLKSNDLDNQEWMFLVKQPLAIQRATMQVNLPTGINSDGVIQYSNQNIKLSSAKREVNFEFAYKNKIDKNQSLQVNALYINHEGGIANKKNFFVGLNYNIKY